MVASAAEMDAAAAESVEQEVIVGRGELAVKFGREVHCAVVAQKDRASVPEVRPIRPMRIHLRAFRNDLVPLVQKRGVGLRDQRKE